MQYLILGALFATIAAQAQNKPDSGSIEGHVFNTLTSAPVRKATVTLDAVARGIHLVAETDSEGKFEFTGLPGGGYRLTASRAGFLERRALNRVVLGPEQHLTKIGRAHV